MVTFEQQVKIALIKKEMTQTELADDLGISHSYLRDLIRGYRTSEERIQQIKDYLSDVWEEDGSDEV